VCLVFASSRADAQLLDSYPDYLERLAGFQERSAELIKKINDIAVVPKYCDEAQRRADGRALAEAFAALGDLRRDWADFKAGVNKYAKTPQGISAFGAESRNPNDPNFWTQDDRDIIGHAQADLDALRERFRASKVIDCSAPHVTQPPAPPVGARPKADPLAGLTRPKLITQTIPPRPGPFCSEEERWAWINSVLKPLLQANIDASWALRGYGDKLWARLQAATPMGKPADQAAVDVLEREIRWEQADHAKLDKIYVEQISPLLAWALSKDAVIDCSQHQTAPAPTPTGGTTAPGGTSGGSTTPVIPIDTNKPRSDPPKANPPRVGLVPPLRGRTISVFGGYEWNSFPSFPKVIGDAPGIAGADGKSTTGGSYFGVGLRYVGWHFSVCRHTSVLRYSQLLNEIGSNYQQVDGKLTGSLYDFSTGRDTWVGWNTYVEWGLGYTLAYDVLDMTPRSLSSSSTQNRSLLTGKLNLGLSLRHPLVNNVDLSAGFGLHTSGRTGKDADNERSLQLGLSYNLHY
jgi:hypothetical protein